MARYACSDLHGRYDIYEKICEILKPEDIVYFLGDACDRSSKGWPLIKAIYNNPQWVYLKGNHEDMLFKTLTEYFDPEYSSYYWYHMCIQNGGYQTFEDAVCDPEVKEWMIKINNLPTRMEVRTNQGVICLCHSGRYFTARPKEHLWDREHLNYPWSRDENEYIVHGHTPTQIMREELMIPYKLKKEVIFYANKHKINIDIGAVWTNEAALLDLDTFKIHIVKGLIPENSQ